MRIKGKNIIVGIVIATLLLGVVFQYFYYKEELNNIKPTIIEKEKLVVSVEKIYIPPTPTPEPVQTPTTSNTKDNQPPATLIPKFVITKTPITQISHSIYIDGLYHRITELDQVTSANPISVKPSEGIYIKVSELNTPRNLWFVMDGTEIFAPAYVNLYVMFNEKGTYTYKFMERSDGYPTIKDKLFISGTINVY